MITHFINWIKGLFSKKEEPIILEEIKEEIQEVVKPQRAEHCTSHARFKKSCRPCQAAIAGLAY
jgi:hypothetical protein